ncbi:uncharacterized protein LOC120918416 [Rana temporaria]|uniref:uncharacterized protein LOC120918416 n=1 Tax=Rana temporaria TaxID=8407 RepID=UPI001AAD75ED|nr:uncharacterized protein LOC120918416 [Rana temporaria]XP_040185899.1 uncharacterized protein LOC120918416 [Rana temporaria]
MPSCIVATCRSHWRRKEPNLKFHVFPKDKDRIRIWLRNTGQFDENDLDQAVLKIIEGKQNDSYRMCSKHFSSDMYHQVGSKILLKKNAIPNMFFIVYNSAIIDLDDVAAKRHCAEVSTFHTTKALDKSLPFADDHTLNVTIKSEIDDDPDDVIQNRHCAEVSTFHTANVLNEFPPANDHIPNVTIKSENGYDSDDNISNGHCAQMSTVHAAEVLDKSSPTAEFNVAIKSESSDNPDVTTEGHYEESTIHTAKDLDDESFLADDYTQWHSLNSSSLTNTCPNSAENMFMVANGIRTSTPNMFGRPKKRFRVSRGIMVNINVQTKNKRSGTLPLFGCKNKETQHGPLTAEVGIQCTLLTDMATDIAQNKASFI